MISDLMATGGAMETAHLQALGKRPGILLDDGCWTPTGLEPDEFLYLPLQGLTIWPPWPWAIFNGAEPGSERQGAPRRKDVENRQWAPPHRTLEDIGAGRPVWLAVHQGLNQSDVRQFLGWTPILPPHAAQTYAPMVVAVRDGTATWYNGCIVGIARLVAVWQPKTWPATTSHGHLLACAPGFQEAAAAGRDSPWRDPEQYAWVLALPRRCRPVPVAGKQKLWPVSDKLRLAMGDAEGRR